VFCSLTQLRMFNKGLTGPCHPLCSTWFVAVTPSASWQKKQLWVCSTQVAMGHDSPPQQPQKWEPEVLLGVDFSFLYSYLFDQVWIRVVH
jgi:hypothetical protein